MDLVIVESPTKARTIQKFLGSKYKIASSFGHVRDLPKRELGIDVEKNFAPKYIVPAKAKKVIGQLKKDAKKASHVILATDEDREGESISWHLQQALGLENPQRIVFHEITKGAIEEALKNPRQIDMHLVDAQQARRVLDRIVGYKLSPFLWKKIAKGLSAGRVQSVAVRMVVERERQIQAFKPQEYWTVEAMFKKGAGEFAAQLIKKGDKTFDKFEIGNKEQANQLVRDLEGATYHIAKIERKETRRNPLPPFTTSTLQQAAWQRLHLSAKYAMSLAQKLYEEGHITYHRTDSLNLSETSLAGAREFITKAFGQKYASGPRRYKAGKNAQEAHEAIRPTRPEADPASLKGSLEPAQAKLYTLIWQRFCASQMTPAVFDATSVEINAGEYVFGASGQILKFDGFLKVYPMKISENEMPALAQGEWLNLKELKSLQHFTEPPARYHEASLIKALEHHGIGRPSTYAPTLSTIQERNYIAKNEQKKFFPTEMGFLVNDMLVANFPQIVDIDFTRSMEEQLDQVAQGKEAWQKACEDFYGPFARNLKEKYETVEKENLDIKTDKKCPVCGREMVEKMGRFGRFYACSGFPECKHTESVSAIAEPLDIICPKCKAGKINAKKTKRGKIFYGCSTYPACDFALWDKPIGEFCPQCQSILVETKSKKIKCSSKTCDYSRETLPIE